MPWHSSLLWSAYVTIGPKRFDHEFFDQSFFCSCNISPQKWTNCSSNRSHLFVPQNLGQTVQSEQLDQDKVWPAWTYKIWSQYNDPEWQSGGRKEKEILDRQPPLQLPPWHRAPVMLYLAILTLELTQFYICNQINKFGQKDYAWGTSRWKDWFGWAKHVGIENNKNFSKAINSRHQ